MCDLGGVAAAIAGTGSAKEAAQTSDSSTATSIPASAMPKPPVPAY